MKQTKNNILKKITGVTAAFVLCTSFGISQMANGNNRFVSSADPVQVYQTGKELRVKNFPTSVAQEGASNPIVKLPVAEIINADIGDEVIVTVVNPFGQAVTLNDEPGFEGSFIGEYPGDYTVSYLVTNSISGVTTELKSLRVTVIGEKASFKFAENSPHILPTTYNAALNKPIVIPMPKVLDSKGEEIVGAEDDVVVVVRKGTDPALAIETVGGNKQFTIPTSVTSGIYTVRYSYTIGTREVATKTETITVTNAFSSDYAIGYNFKSSFPTTAVVGVATQLPAVQAFNKSTNANVQSYYSIKVFKTGTTVQDVTTEMLDEDNKFTATEEGNYYAQYTVTDFFGNQAAMINWAISYVSDTQRATPKVVAPYIVPVDGIVNEEEIEEVLWALPSNGSIQQKLVLPALYGSDNAIKNANSLRYSRYVINNTTSEKTVLDSYDPAVEGSVLNANKNLVLFAPEGYEPAADEVLAAATLIAGKYTVYYEVKDVKNAATSVNYALEIVSGPFVDEIAPTITFSTALPASVKPGAMVSFALPTAADKNASGTVVDARPRVQTFYEIDTVAKEMADIADILDLETMPEISETNSGMYQISVPLSDTAGKKLFIYVVSTDDSGNQALLVKTINVINIEDDVAPEFDEVNFDIAGSSFDLAQIDQDERVFLPTITFNDNIVTHTNIKAFVYHVTTGEVFDVTNQRITRDLVNGSITMENAEFQATLYGEYNITFVATDAGNNMSAKSFSLNVAQTIASTITLSSLPSELINQKMELGTKVEMPVPKVVSSNGTEVLNPVYTVTQLAGGNAELDAEKFVPFNVGTYKIAYNIFEEIGGVPVQTYTQTYTIVVSDTKAPTINVNGSVPTVLPLNHNLELPRFTASDSFAAPTTSDPNWIAYGVGIKTSSLKLEILRNGLVERTINFEDTNANYYHSFTQNGTFTIRYSAEDLLGQKSTEEFSIKVGDVQNPTMVIENEAKNKPTTMKLGSRFIVDTTAITISDDKDEEINNDNILTKLNVVVTNTSTGEVVANLLKDEEGAVTGFEYLINKVGTYRVQYYVRDNAGNTESQYHSFTVSEENNEGSIINSDFWTPFLIVLSLLVLGGVISYFAISKGKANRVKF